jgi:uncharacterized protein (DUF1330 family)
MKTKYAIALAIVSAVGGAVTVQGLHAQAKPPALYIAMNDVHDRANYVKEFLPKTTPLIKAAHGQFLARGGKVTKIKGEAPKERIVIIRFESMDKLLAWWNSPANTDAQKIGDKYATIHSFAVEGVAQ